LWGAALEACAEGLALVENHRLAYVNPALAQLLGYSHASELEGRLLSELLPAQSPMSAFQLLTFPGEQREGVRRDGTRLRLETSHSQFSFAGREYSIFHIRELSRVPLDAAQWREAQRMEAIGRLVSGVCHDFNNLLTGIILGCELLLNKMGKADPLRRYPEEIRLAASQGTTLIAQLLAIARQRAVEPQIVSWNEIIANMAIFLGRLIGENIELVTDLGADVSLVKTDPALVQQIILNLVVNARDAMPDGGRIVLKTRNATLRSQDLGRDRRCIELTVADTGCGMDEHTRAHAFEQFFTTKAPGRGNGMGLATVHSIVTGDGGTIAVKSEPGKGTSVIIHVPCLESDRKPGPEPTGQSENSGNPHVSQAMKEVNQP
jgi:two-component system, cell cycle sensor histidine kinase and response regulator CckA